MFAFGAATFALMQWITTIAFCSDAASTVAVGNHREAGLITNSPTAGATEAALIKVRMERD
jgi:hypothetical protein